MEKISKLIMSSSRRLTHMSFPLPSIFAPMTMPNLSPPFNFQLWDQLLLPPHFPTAPLILATIHPLPCLCCHLLSTLLLSPTKVLTSPLPLHLPPPPLRRLTAKVSPAQLEELAHVVYSINPYSAKHGDKKSQWEEVAKKLKDKGMFLASSVDTIRNKMTALLAYFEVSLLFTPFNRELKPLPRIPILMSARRSHGSF